MNDLDKELLYYAELAGKRDWFSLMTGTHEETKLMSQLINAGYIQFKGHPELRGGRIVFNYEFTRKGFDRVQELKVASESK